MPTKSTSSPSAQKSARNSADHKAKLRANAAKAGRAQAERKLAAAGLVAPDAPLQDKVAQEMARLNAIEFSPISFLVAIAEAKVLTLRAYRINPRDVTLKIRKEAATDVLPYISRRQPLAPVTPGTQSPETEAERIAKAVREMGLATTGDESL